MLRLKAISRVDGSRRLALALIADFCFWPFPCRAFSSGALSPERSARVKVIMPAMAETAQGHAAGATAEGARRAIPHSVVFPAAPGTIAEPVAAFQPHASRTAESHAEPHGNLGAPDSRAERVRREGLYQRWQQLPPDRRQAVRSALTATARHATRGPPTGDRVRRLQEALHARRTQYARRRFQTSARPAEPQNARRKSSKDVEAISRVEVRPKLTFSASS